MAAPTPTVRLAPAAGNILIPEGFKALITLSNKPNIGFWEQSVKPPSIDGGDGLDITNQHNTLWHTVLPRKLLKRGPVVCRVMYDPDVIADIVAQMNVNQTLTWLYPDGSTEAMFGFMNKWEPGELKVDETPMADVTFTPSMYDPVNKVEAAPVLTAVVGT
jgi:hypothetical protein